MNFPDFETQLKTILIYPMSVKEINSKFTPSLSKTQIHRFINYLSLKGILLYTTDRSQHPKKYPIKFYFINPLPIKLLKNGH